jgi:hypothetical protein
MSDTAASPPGHHVKRFFLGLAAAFLSVNIWTGGPLFALWVGAHLQTTSQLTMGTVAVIMGLLIAIILGLIWLLSRVSHAYQIAAGVEQRRRTQAWMRSMRDERSEWEQERHPMTGFEKMLIVMVVIAAASFEGWFFLFSGSSIGHG